MHTPAIPAEPRPARAEAGESRREIDDRLVRFVGIPAFGIAIPRLTDLFAGTGASDPVYWLGSLWFLGLAAAIWHGNRWLLLEQRRHWGWFDHPVRKVVTLLAAIVLFTAPLTITALAGWYAWRDRAPEWPAIQTVVLINVICVVFVTHVYETVFLIKEREADHARVLALDRARVEAEMQAFLAQVDPHFLFNSLNTLGHLITVDPVRARAFTEHLAELHRYLLRGRGRTLVTLDEELGFVADYTALMRIRFGDAFELTVIDEGADRGARLPPTAIQLLVENAIKHNQVGEGRPLAVTVRLGATVVVENVRRPRTGVRASAGVGLANLDERIKLACGKRIAIRETTDAFVVEVPLS
ncbi:MAG: histidine kinase [Kofleriaceae bacterium]